MPRLVKSRTYRKKNQDFQYRLCPLGSLKTGLTSLKLLLVSASQRSQRFLSSQKENGCSICLLNCQTEGRIFLRKNSLKRPSTPR